MPIVDWHDEACGDLCVRAEEPPAPGAFILARGGRKHRLELPRKLATRHVLIFGPSGSGKSKGFFLGNCAYARGASLVATDPKGELWDSTSGYHPRTLRFAPREPDASAAFNWVPLCDEAHRALLVARALVGRDAVGPASASNPDAERALTAALFAHAATLPEPTPAAAYDLLTSHDRATLLATLTRSPSLTARRFANLFALAEPALQGTVALAVGTRLSFLADPAVRRFTSASREPVDLGVLRREATAAYWALREDDMAPLRPLSSLFFALLLHQLKRAEGRVPVTLLLDEFANLGDVPDFETEITIARGHDIAFVLGVQSIGQLERVYGRANARTIYENCQTVIALSGLTDDTAELVARTITPEPAARDDDDDARITANDIRRLGKKEMLVVLTNRPPLRLVRLDFDGDARAARTARLGGSLSAPASSPAERRAQLRGAARGASGRRAPSTPVGRASAAAAGKRPR